MVQAIINISAHTNQVLNIIKAKFALKNKSEAIELMAEQYERELLQPELRPEYVEKARGIMEQEPMKVGTVSDLKKRYS